MTADWVDMLSVIDGNEQFYLASALMRASAKAAVAAEIMAARGEIDPGRGWLLIELQELHTDVLLQSARIPMSFRAAQATLQRARFARGHIMRVPGTD